MADLKTTRTGASVEAFIQGIADDDRQEDCVELVDLMRRATGLEPEMWGPSIVGFGSYHYTYASGREGDWFLVGFAPRKRDLTLYVTSGFDRYEDVLARLGRYRTGRACLYIKRLADVDVAVLEELVSASVSHAAHANAHGGTDERLGTSSGQSRK
jgi:hypothetical protein